MFGRIFWPVFVVFLSFGVVACSSPKTPQNDSGTPPGDNTTQTPDAPDQGGPLACTTDNPQGCSATGCEEGFVCEISADPCVSSSCSCDEETGSWICTGDCGGGTCVPAPTSCEGENPQGCSATGCEEGFFCDTSGDPCVSSTCSCDEESNSWICTSDCNGGTCVPASTGCEGENPEGCSKTGCEEGFVCDTSGDPCVSSGCDCDEETGMWTCDEDCNGGTCVPKQSCGENPEGCRNNGCEDGLLCSVGEVCVPTNCTDCNEDLGLWNCTKDCNGGTCGPIPECGEDKVPTIDGCVGCSQAMEAIQGLKESSMHLFNACETVDDCTTTGDDIDCAGACPVAVNAESAQAYQDFLNVISSNYCQGYVQECGYSTPSCMQGTLICKDNICQQTF